MSNTSNDLVAYVDRAEATHVYGRKIEGSCTNLSDALLDAGMYGWDVRKEDVFTSDGFQIPGHSAIVGDVGGKKVGFAVAKSRYTVVDYPSAFALGQNILDSSELSITALGYYRGGGRGFVEFAVPDTIQVGGYDDVQAYLRIASSHDMSAPIVASLGLTRTRCTNEFSTLLGNTIPNFRIKHTGADPMSSGRMADARSALGVVFAGMDEFTVRANEWLDTGATAAQFDEITARMFPIDREQDTARVVSRMENSREGFQDTVQYSDAQASLGGLNAYSIMQGAMEWSQWRESPKDDQARATRVLDGGLAAGQRATAGIISDVLALV